MGADPGEGDFITVPFVPTEAQWDGLARSIMMWLDMGDKTPRALFQHLARSGKEIPQWLKDEPEMQALNHVPSKGTRCVLIYRAMLEDARREGLRQMVALDEEMGLYDDQPIAPIDARRVETPKDGSMRSTKAGNSSKTCRENGNG